MKSVDDVAGIADALGSNRFAVVGHDWGVGLAWQTALSRLAPRERVAAVFVLSISFTPGSPTPPDPGVHGHPSRDVLLHTLEIGRRVSRRRNLRTLSKV
jgi:pimeloyl-ACP methyl ester carboxylesterase